MNKAIKIVKTMKTPFIASYKCARWQSLSKKSRNERNLQIIRNYAIPYEGLIKDQQAYLDDSLEKPPILFFNHIPKNGGSTMRHILRANAGHYQFLSINRRELMVFP